MCFKVWIVYELDCIRMKFMNYVINEIPDKISRIYKDDIKSYEDIRH
jgi:hypothetical protein